jgi:C_GCAxxG_C_C family probable redox protein
MQTPVTRVASKPWMPVIPADPQWPARMNGAAIGHLRRYDSCTQAILWTFMEALQMKDPMVLRAGGAMQGGMMSSLTCGVHTAGLMILGMLIGREDLDTGLDGLMPIVGPGQELVRRLTRRLGGHACLEMTGVDFTDLNAALAYKLSEDHRRCVERVGNGAETIARLLQEQNDRGELFRPDVTA